jgi:acyl-homoserine-lactone acylase
MKKLILLFAAVSISLAFQGDKNADLARWKQQAKNVTIIRDDWGIAHVYGKTDADAVFGMEYAQAEDDFNRVETNYINAMGRLAEAEGESRIYQDLRMKLFIDPEALKKEYAASPPWLQKLMNAFADGLNYYLAKHPEVKPRVIQHFEPWMALSFHRRQHRRRHREGQPGATAGASTASLPVSRNARAGGVRPGAQRLQRRGRRACEHRQSSRAAADQSAHLLLLPLGTADGERRRAERLWRRDLGPVFLYQGFNERAGWMHTRAAWTRSTSIWKPSPRRATTTVTSTATRSAADGSEITVPYKTATGWRRRNSRSTARTTGPSSAKPTASGWPSA